MSNSPLVEHINISPNKTVNRNHKIDTITIHCMVGQCSAETCGNIFANPARQASSNYGIGYDGKIGMYVEEKDRSWCSSSRENDHRAITIEVASDTKPPYAVKEAAYNSLIKLLIDICKRNGIKELKWKGDKSLIGQVDKQNMTVHRWFANKSCPGDYLYEKHGEIAMIVNTELNKENNITNSLNIKKGDLVSINKNSVYYNGKNIPLWVQQKNWYVEEINGDRVVINESEDGKNKIKSAIHKDNLTKITTSEKVVDIVEEKFKPYTVSITANLLNVRKEPSIKSSIVTTIKKNEVYTIVEESKGNGASKWGKLKSGIGWISLDYAKK